MNLIFLGAPGAGKGTQAENIAAKYNIPTISTGVILRESIAEGTEMGLKAKSFIDSGALVPDEIVIGIVKDRLKKDDCKNGFIFDGFPRTVPQAQYLKDSGVPIDLVIDIDVPDEKIVERMSGRRVCKACGSSYHVVYKPSRNGEDCDKCDGGKLSIRDDDRPEVVKSRLETYHNQTEPLKDFYGKLGLLRTVIGQEEVADTTALTIAIVESHK